MIKGKVCVFCGASDQIAQEFFKVAQDVGRMIGELDLGLVYGGGKCGMMGVLADAALQAGAPVYGILPAGLRDLEVAHTGLTELFITENLFDRKQKLIESADVFVILPGGLGTLDEFFEVITHKSLGYHSKPTVVFDYKNFYSPFLNWSKELSDAGFIREIEDHFLIARNLEELKSFLTPSDLPES